MGTLYPTYRLCYIAQGFELKLRVQILSKVVQFVFSSAILCGVIIAYLLIKDLNALLYSSYGNMLLLKISMVVMIFVLAIINKYQLTPRLDTTQGIHYLSMVIRIEMLVGLIILMITAFFTTVIGVGM